METEIQSYFDSERNRYVSSKRYGAFDKNGEWDEDIRADENGTEREIRESIKKQNKPPKKESKSQKKTIKEKVIENAETLKAMKTHTELREWAISNGMDNRAAFPKFKTALNVIGLNYDQIKTGINKVKAEELEKLLKYSLTLYSDAKASFGNFGITDKDGNVVWYGKFFPDDNADEQSRAELASAKKAVWFASKVKESLGQNALLLNLIVDAEWLTYQDHSGQKGYALTILARKYNIKLNVSWISGKDNPADKWTTEHGYKKWQDNDFKSLVEPIESDNEEVKRELENIEIKEIKKSLEKTITTNICKVVKETEQAINVSFRLNYPEINYQREIETWLPKSQAKIIGNKIEVNERFWNKKIEEIKLNEMFYGIINYKEFENAYSILLLFQEPVIHSTLEPRAERIFLNVPKKYAHIYNNILYFPYWLYLSKEKEIKEDYEGDDYMRRNLVFNQSSDIEEIKPELISCDNNNDNKLEKIEVSKENNVKQTIINMKNTEIQNEISSLQEALEYAQTDAEKQGLQKTIDELENKLAKEPKQREPKFKENDSVKVIKSGKIETIESMGAWDKEAKEYRLLWSHGGIGFESDLEPIKLFSNKEIKTEPLYKNGNKVSYQSPDGWNIGIIENANYHEKNKNDILSLDGWYYEIKGIPNLKVSEKDVKPYTEITTVKTFEYYKGIDFKYENQFQKNKAIEELIYLKVKHEIITTNLMNRIEITENNLTSDETLFINSYTGMGGLDKFGATGQGILYEYYTLDEIIKMMWALAYKYGHKTSSVLEPSCGIGRFFKYAKNEVAEGYELNLKSAIICKILYPYAIIFNNYFEQIFIKNNNSVKDKIYAMPKYNLVIGNPPYGDISGGGSKWLGMGEQKYSGATNYIDYFIYRGLDLLFPKGLLIYIVGAEKHNGGKLFLEKGTSNIKEAIAEKCELVDAYKLPSKLFQTTSVSSEIIVLRKK